MQFDGVRKALPCSAKGFEPQHTESEARNLFFKTAYLSHFSDFASLKNLSEFYFCFALQIRMRICEPYIEISKNAYYLALNAQEHRLMIESLNQLRNKLIADGKYTDAVDEVLLKIIDAKQKKFKVIYKEA